MLGVSDVIARSTLARNHASYAAASSLVANSDSMGVRAGILTFNFDRLLMEAYGYHSNKSIFDRRVERAIPINVR
jgi:hypothetical protein